MSPDEQALRARDRTQQPKGTPTKKHRWPRTTRRGERIAHVLSRRQPDLTVVLEDVHDAHNVSAVLRTCDAVGALDVHLVYIEEEVPRRALARTTSGSAAKWMRTTMHASIESCYAELHRQGFAVYTTALDERSQCIYDVDLARPVALVFGNEMRGASPAAVEHADGTLVIPMMGMVQSLNISVACAVVLYEALRQRRATGAYDNQRLDDATIQQLAAEWLEK